MKHSWLALLTITVLGLLAGVAIAGRPTSVDRTVIPAATTAAPNSAAPATTTTSTTAVVTTARTVTTTAAATTTTAPVDRTSFRVVAANGTTTLGLAGRITLKLLELGYTQVSATDAIGQAPASTIYYRFGFVAAARQVATDLGLPATAVAELTAPVSRADADGDVIAALREDLAE